MKGGREDVDKYYVYYSIVLKYEINSESNFGLHIFFFRNLLEKWNVQKKGVETSGFHGFDAISSKALVNVNVNVIWLRCLDKGLPLHHVIVKSSKLFNKVTVEAGDDG